MSERQIREIVPGEKRRVAIRFDSGETCTLYKSELGRLPAKERELLLEEGAYIVEELYQKVLHGIITPRARKRAMFLLEQMDRTEHQLCEKLRQNGYPEECIGEAVDYVKRYHYIDDLRYARSYVRCRQQKRSRQRLMTDLIQRGVAKPTIEQALLEEYEADERGMIRELLGKRRFDPAEADVREKRRTYQFLLRRGYRSGDILAVMQTVAEDEF
ncbi:MAG: regulatory protein RecX [Roseburia sp.]|jgi:regulatory protein|nr:regulatory protein RecX [Roseburia sp.]